MKFSTSHKLPEFWKDKEAACYLLVIFSVKSLSTIRVQFPFWHLTESFDHILQSLHTPLCCLEWDERPSTNAFNFWHQKMALTLAIPGDQRIANQWTNVFLTNITLNLLNSIDHYIVHTSSKNSFICWIKLKLKKSCTEV